MARGDNGFSGAAALLVLLLATGASAQVTGGARVASLATTDLVEFDAQPPAVKGLLTRALQMTTQNLGYQYGSADPKNGAMDCSGTIYFLLRAAGVIGVPRDSSQMYRWVWTQGNFQAVNSASADTFELARLKPGDLLFWTGTYDTKHDPPVSHVMIYLGTSKLTGRRVMVGASDGRTFNGVPRYGVSVFDFVLPKPEATSRFIGYGAIPGLDEAAAPP